MEIEFRGKSIDSGNWVYGSYVYLEYDNGHFLVIQHKIVTKLRYEFEVIPESVGQYTGLKDKNGKKIYEGDIVRWVDTEGHEIIKVVNYKVAFAGWCYGTLPVTTCWSSAFMQKKEEKIGNIYENPEIMETKKD